MKALRFALLCVIALMLLSVVIGVFATETGAPEKVALAALGALLVYAASLVRRLGTTPEPR